MKYDVIIIGAGSAGLPAGMYASRYKLSNLVIGAELGGALATSHRVENWPGVKSASGRKIMDDFYEHAKEAGSEFLFEHVESIDKTDEGFKIKTISGKEFESDYVIFATGNKHRKLGIPGEDTFHGKGVSVCATCDGMFFKGRDVVIVGGGNTALTEAIYLSEIVNKVYLVHRRDTFRAEDSWVDIVKNTENIELVLNEEVESIEGDIFLEKVNLKSGRTINADGFFVSIGSDPDIKLVEHLNPEVDAENCLVVDQRQETSIPGLYAAGDVTTNSNKFKQTIMSAAEGCLAADSIHTDKMKGAK